MNVLAGAFIGWLAPTLLIRLGASFGWAIVFCGWRTVSGALNEYVEWANSTGSPAPRSGSAEKDFYVIEFGTAFVTSMIFASASGWIHQKWFT